MILNDKCHRSFVPNHVWLAFQNILPDSVCNSFLCGLCQRFGSIKYRFSQIRPVDVLATLLPLWLRIFKVCLLRPDNIFPISSEDCIPAFPRCRCSVISSHQFPTIEYVAQSLHGRYKFLVILAQAFFDRMSIFIKRAPLLYFLNIFHDNHIGQDCFCVLVYRPRKDSQPTFSGLSSFCLTMACAIWRCPH